MSFLYPQPTRSSPGRRSDADPSVNLGRDQRPVQGSRDGVCTKGRKAEGGGPVSSGGNDGDRGGLGAGRAGEGLDQGKGLQ